MTCLKVNITKIPNLKVAINKVSSELSIGISRVEQRLCLSLERPVLVAKASLFQERLKTAVVNVTPLMKVVCTQYCDVVTQYYIKVTPKEEQWVSDRMTYKVLSNVDYEVSANVDWIHLYKGYNSVSVLTDINVGLDRSGEIKFYGGGAMTTRKVLQSGMREIFNEDFILADGGTFNVFKR